MVFLGLAMQHYGSGKRVGVKGEGWDQRATRKLQLGIPVASVGVVRK